MTEKIKLALWCTWLSLFALPTWAAPQFMGNYGGNYDHLARVWEWHVVGGEEGDSE